jgi:hypothetical protein
MVIRDTDFEYFVLECIKYGAAEDVAGKATVVRVTDKASKETGQSPQEWDAAEGKWVDVPELTVDLSLDSDFGQVRPRRKTAVFTLLGKDGKKLWSSGK